MEELLAELLAGFRERAWPRYTRRDVELPGLEGKVDAVIGMRRAGKTTYLFQVMDGLVEEGWSPDDFLYLNFEDERLTQLRADELHLVLDVFYRHRPEARDRRCAFFFDEIQVVEGWERFVRRILDTENAHVCVSGSSADLLSREIATSLRGRSLATEVCPFSFGEFLRHHDIELTAGAVSASVRSRLEHALGRYLAEGGFPEVQGLDTPLRVRILQDYLDVVLLRDIVERHGVTNVSALRALVLQLLNAPATQFSVSKFHRDMKSRGIAVGKNSVYDFMRYIEDAFLVFTVPIHTYSERIRQVNPAKVYPIDPGLVRAVSTSPGPDLGPLLETVVYLALRRRCRTTEYYRTESRYEVDFIVEDWEGARSLVQVCANMNTEATRDREVRALREAIGETDIDDARIVTMNDRGSIDGIDLIPAWRFLLDL